MIQEHLHTKVFLIGPHVRSRDVSSDYDRVNISFSPHYPYLQVLLRPQMVLTVQPALLITASFRLAQKRRDAPRFYVTDAATVICDASLWGWRVIAARKVNRPPKLQQQIVVNYKSVRYIAYSRTNDNKLLISLIKRLIIDTKLILSYLFTSQFFNLPT